MLRAVEREACKENTQKGGGEPIVYGRARSHWRQQKGSAPRLGIKERTCWDGAKAAAEAAKAARRVSFIMIGNRCVKLTRLSNCETFCSCCYPEPQRSGRAEAGAERFFWICFNLIAT